jgi:hypothetical protein
MSDHKKNLNREIIGLFSGQSSQVTIPKLYIEITGSYSLAIVLNQAVFWSNKSSCKDGFFYKTYEEWFDEIHIPERTLRRRFNALETSELITTKVKKVKGANTKHVKPHTDRIIELISIMMDGNNPIRPSWPVGTIIEPKTCTKTVPYGQVGRLEPANLAGSYITEDHLQNKNTTTEIKSSSSDFFSKKQRSELTALRHTSDRREESVFLDNCRWHIEKQANDNSVYQRVAGLKKILKGINETREVFKAQGYTNSQDEKLKLEQDANHQAEFEKLQDEQGLRRMREMEEAVANKVKSKPSQQRNGVSSAADLLKRYAKNAN